MSIELETVSVTAGGKRLIEDVSLTITPGKLTAILGANGAGKSTTLNVVAGDLRPASGRVLIDGVEMSQISLADLARRRAVIGQHAPINFPFQVHEVIGMARYPATGAATDHDACVTQAMQALQLTGCAARDYTTLSGGERQRVHIARALAQLGGKIGGDEAVYLLMDEPTTHLDLKHQIVALEVARGFADQGAGVLCILHDLALAREFADVIILMKHGRIVGHGAPQHVLKADTVCTVFGISPARYESLTRAAF